MPSRDKYTDPDLRDKVKEEVQESDKGGAAGQWSARKAQMMASEYRKRGGGYTTDKESGQDESQKSLSRWTDEDWQTKDGECEARQQDGSRKRYLPKKAWEKMDEAEKEATDEKKREASKGGRQFVGNTDKAKKSRKQAQEEDKENDEENEDDDEENEEEHGEENEGEEEAENGEENEEVEGEEQDNEDERDEDEAEVNEQKSNGQSTKNKSQDKGSGDRQAKKDAGKKTKEAIEEEKADEEDDDELAQVDVADEDGEEEEEEFQPDEEAEDEEVEDEEVEDEVDEEDENMVDDVQQEEENDGDDDAERADSGYDSSEREKQESSQAQAGQKRGRSQQNDDEGGEGDSKKQKSNSGKASGTIGSKHDKVDAPAQQGAADRLPQKGAKVSWKALPGWVHGELVEVVTSQKKVQGKDVKGSKNDPRFVLKADSGKICVHKPESCYYES